MLTRLSQDFIQTKNNRDESSLTISVAYDTEEKEVDRIISVYVYDYKEKRITDITAIMIEQFPEQLNDMIESINWDELHRFRVHDKDVVVHDSVSLIKSLQSHFI